MKVKFLILISALLFFSETPQKKHILSPILSDTMLISVKVPLISYLPENYGKKQELINELNKINIPTEYLLFIIQIEST